MEARKVLRKMRKLLETHNLAKGRLYEFDFNKPFRENVIGMCIRGAGLIALRELGGHPNGEDFLWKHVYPKLNKLIPGFTSDNPALWNDRDTTTKEAVINLLKKAEDPRRWGHIVCTI
jgi:hypothetical protein